LNPHRGSLWGEVMEKKDDIPLDKNGRRNPWVNKGKSHNSGVTGGSSSSTDTAQTQTTAEATT